MQNTHLQAREAPITVGEVAPDFTLLDQDREPWSLAEAIKKGDVVLCFYPMSFTGVCGTEMSCITSEFDAWKSKGAEVVGISADSFAVQKAWAEQMQYAHRLLADMHREVCRAYGFYWPELNVASRGTVVISGSADGQGVVKWVQSREPGSAMDWAEVMGHVEG